MNIPHHSPYSLCIAVPSGSLCRFRNKLSKSLKGILAFALLLTSTLYADQTDIDNYDIIKFATYDQTSTATPTLNVVSGNINVNMTSPGSVPPTPTVLFPDSSVVSLVDQGTYWNYNDFFGSIAALDAAWTLGTYQFTIPTTSGVPTTFTPSFSMPAMVSTIPTLSNTSWSGGNLVLDYSLGNNISWNVNDATTYYAEINGSLGSFFSYSGDASDLSFSIAAGTLQAGETYNAYLSLYNRVSDTSQIPGVYGEAVTYAQTYFNIINVVPEPSTYTLVFGSIALLAMASRKKRK